MNPDQRPNPSFFEALGRGAAATLLGMTALGSAYLAFETTQAEASPVARGVALVGWLALTTATAAAAVGIVRK